MLLVFCLIDALAKKSYPTEPDNKKRYCRYLKNNLAKIGENSGYRIEEENKVLHISEIIYKYFRCNYVHEANDLVEKNYEIQIEYGQKIEDSVFNTPILMNLPEKKFIIKADYLLVMLIEIVKNDPFFKSL